jgi:putative nucleotidyltransferase with HDIG domain
MVTKQARGEQLLDLLSAEVELPRLTSVASELLSFMHMPMAQIDLQRLASLAEGDPMLSAVLLRTANSAYFGALREIKTVPQAIMRMGLEDTMHILSYHCLRGVMPSHKRLQNFSLKHFWLHSWATATAARMLGRTEYLVHALPGELYTAGLLHDIGKVVLAGHAGELFDRACAVARARGVPLHQTEIEVIELDHATLGRHMLDAWNLPLPILEAVGGHHEPASAPAGAREIAMLIELADAIAYRCGFADGTGQPARDPMQTVIVSDPHSPLAAPKTFQCVLDLVSDGLSRKSLMFQKRSQPAHQVDETASARSRHAANRAPIRATPPRHIGLWKRMFASIDRLFDN